MCKSEIFAKILRIVSKETEVSEDLILSKCKRSDIVDSRGIMVVILSEYKFSESQIIVVYRIYAAIDQQVEKYLP